MRSIVNRSDAGHILRRYRRFFFLRHRSQFMQQLPRRFTVRIRFLLTDCCFPAACDARLSPALFLPLSRKRCSCKGLQNFFRRQFYEAGMLKRPPEGLRRNRRRFLIMIAPREESLQRLPLILASNVQSGTATEAAIGAILLAELREQPLKHRHATKVRKARFPKFIIFQVVYSPLPSLLHPPSAHEHFHSKGRKAP